MQTQLSSDYQNSSVGNEADRVLRGCVHCGFCNATCPTYQLLGDELDGPRGRIYQIKQILEGHTATASIQLHLDRCLTCRACETTCPSGVEYHKLLDIGRDLVEQQVKRPWRQRLIRKLLCTVLPYRNRFMPLLRVGQVFRWMLPSKLKQQFPAHQTLQPIPESQHNRFVILLEGCVQPGLAPQINHATERVLDRLGIHTASAEQAQCCGALPFHLNEIEQAKTLARNNIDSWWPLIEKGAEAIIINASGCAPMVKDYGHLLQQDTVYAERAHKISELASDLSEFMTGEDLSTLSPKHQRIAFHSPCTLQHAQRLDGMVEALLTKLGFELTTIKDSHLCCGSAGTYSILQPKLSKQLRQNKLDSLLDNQPDLIATANIGCLLHLQQGTEKTVKHWIELLDTTC
jgi:glycolate oxidase iron-sulfur subunit